MLASEAIVKVAHQHKAVRSSRTDEVVKRLDHFGCMCEEDEAKESLEEHQSDSKTMRVATLRREKGLCFM